MKLDYNYMMEIKVEALAIVRKLLHKRKFINI